MDGKKPGALPICGHYKTRGEDPARQTVWVFFWTTKSRQKRAKRRQNDGKDKGTKRAAGEDRKHCPCIYTHKKKRQLRRAVSRIKSQGKRSRRPALMDPGRIGKDPGRKSGSNRAAFPPADRGGVRRTSVQEIEKNHALDHVRRIVFAGLKT